jgi:hypothetical protein
MRLTASSATGEIAGAFFARRALLRLRNAAAQTRIVSETRIRQDPRKSARPFKGIIFPDVSEFESYMPSHAVGSPPANMPQRCAPRGVRISAERFERRALA